MTDKKASLVSPEAFVTFGDLLRYLRRRAGLTQRELSLQVGYSEPQISFLEKNHRLPDVTTVSARFVPALDLEIGSPLAQRLIHLAEASRIERQSLAEAPYKGLQFFDVQDADLFHGREWLTARLVRHLRKRQFLAIVVGASGSGKSSMVRAGLIPALQRGRRLADGSLPPPGSAHWKYYVITPGAHPLESLIAALDGNGSSARPPSGIVKQFIADETSLDSRARQLLGAPKGSPGHDRRHMLLIVDQFEELFTLCQDEKIRQAFIDNLMFSASSGSSGSVSIVIALRADFYIHCARYANLRDRLGQDQEYIGPMSAEEIRRAIEQPALDAGLSFEPGLVDFILKEMGGEPGALPLLSHALLETWKRRKNQTLTFHGYNQSGGIRGAIAQTAETVYLGLDEEQQGLARRIFLSLTELGQASEDGLLTPDTRRRVSLDEWNSDPEGTSRIESLLKWLSDARLIIVTEDSVQVAHEALIREWPRLRQWLSEDRDSLVFHRHLNAAASRWDADGREPEDLYRGSRLAQAAEWAESRAGELSPLARSFLEASASWSERELAEQQAQRRKELLAAKKLAESESRRAEEQKRASQRLRRRAWILTGLLMASVALAVASFALSRDRDRAARLATSRERASASVSNLEVDPERSILLALEALAVAHTREAEDALHQAVFASRVESTLQGHTGLVGVAVFSPDGRQIATAGEDGQVRTWDAASGESLQTLAGHAGPVYEVVFSPNGEQLAAAGEDGTARIWDASTGEVILTTEAEEQAVVGLAFSPDAQALATGGADGSVVVWDVKSGVARLRWQAHEAVVTSIAFRPDGMQVVTASLDDHLIFWDAVSGEKLRTWEGVFDNLAFSDDGLRLMANFPEGTRILDVATDEERMRTGGHTNEVFTAAVDPAWTMVATAGLDRKIVVSDAESGRQLFVLAGHTGEILDVHFSPDGRHLVSASSDGTARVWSTAPAREAVTIRTGNSWGRIAISPDGRWVAIGVDHFLKVWGLEDGTERFSLEMPARATGVAFDPAALRLAGATEDGDIVIWNLASGEKERQFQASETLIFYLVFSPDGRNLASGSEDSLVRVWDSSDGALLLTLEGEPYPVPSVAFSPDGSRLASGSLGSTAMVWDVAGGERLLALRGHTDTVYGIAFSPDGKRIATASRDSTARIWDAEGGEELLRLTGHTSTIVSIFFSPEGGEVATTGRDGVTKLWDASTGELLLNLYGDGEGLIGVAISPEGKRLATAGSESIHVYLLPLDELVTLARTRLTRSLTEEECRQYLHLSQCPADPQ